MGEYFYRTEFIQRILHKRRARRADFILSRVKLFYEMSILDVGCGPDGRSLENFLSNDYRIVGIDLYDPAEVKISHQRFTYFQQDARNLSRFRDEEFDLALSIGMMEHICDRAMLRQMAREIDRVSKQYVIVVPWKYAWIEPHFKFPFFQLLPYFLKVFLTKVFNLHNKRKAVRKNFGHIKNHYQWLSNRKWKEIFKGSKVYITPAMDTIAIIKSE